MRMRKLFMPMFVGLALVGCSNEEELNSGNETNREPKFLSVSINATGVGTRANNTPPGEYEEGSGKENSVKKVRFYFFDAKGQPAEVKKEGEKRVNYYNYENPTGDENDPNNVEKILDATLIIQPNKDNENKEGLPSSIVAVLNPGDEIKVTNTDGSLLSLNDLNEIIQEFSKTATSQDGFLMSNSVYAKDSKKMEEVSVDGHLYPTEKAAKENPVIIHVERVLAKTRLTVGLTATDNGLYKTSSDGSQVYGEEEIYVKFLGWNVTATAGTSRLMKEINPGWQKDLFGSTYLWNTADYYRSFWAVNPTSMTYNYGPFNTTGEAKAANALISFKSGEENPNYTYLQENASDNQTDGTNPTKPSQVIIAAQLVNAKGKEMEFAEYAGERTTIEGLKNKYASAAGLWKDKEDGTGKTEIEISDIELKTATAAGITDQNKDGRYKVYAQLTDAAGQLSWYTSNTTDAKKIDANAVLKELGGAKVWKDGYTYYYFDIMHLNGKAENNVTGKYGVVRNHIYDATITKLEGLGTPVYDPGETIYPEKPENDDAYIAAQIKILSWRIVPNDVELEW